MDALTAHRLHFAFTVMFHYLFPVITMGLALLIFMLKTKGLRGDETASAAARFWIKPLAVSFVMGVATGIPMEFQFGTNWSRFSKFSGGIIGQTLAMEGVFAFFLESTFVYLLLFEEKRLGPRGHWGSSLAVFLGTWLSGYFIVATNAWMQHPVGYTSLPDGTIELASLTALLTNPWLVSQYAHVMLGTTITGSFLLASIGSFYLLRGEHQQVVRSWMPLAVVCGFAASSLTAFPVGDSHAKMVYRYQPAGFAAMEGHFHTEDGAGMVLVGQPNMETLHLDNPIVVPWVLSFMTHARWDARVVGLVDFPKDEWPTSVPGLYYAYHVMAGLGTMFLALMGAAAFFVWRGTLYEQRWLLWALMCALPFPFIANEAGWVTTELARQPWIIYGMMRTADGYSTNVSSGNVAFTLIGFAGMYTLLSVVFLFLMMRILANGPDAVTVEAPAGNGVGPAALAAHEAARGGA
jgi:cytochrome d ubiquinol oxidase subunit I